MSLLDIFQYGFMVRALEAGIVVGIIAPLIGIFLVLRRYALIADTLSHVSLAGIAIGALFGINPMFTALGASVVSAVGIDRLRMRKGAYGESVLALFLSGALALAVVLLSLARGFDTNLLNYLFGSIVTVTTADVITITVLAVFVAVLLSLFYKELVYSTFDERAARVSGIPTSIVNTVLMILTAFTIALSIPIVGVLLVSALIVIPVMTALQFKKGFTRTIIYAEIVSVVSVVAGIILSFYLNLATGGTIVLTMLLAYAIATFLKRS